MSDPQPPDPPRTFSFEKHAGTSGPPSRRFWAGAIVVLGILVIGGLWESLTSTSSTSSSASDSGFTTPLGCRSEYLQGDSKNGKLNNVDCAYQKLIERVCGVPAEDLQPGLTKPAQSIGDSPPISYFDRFGTLQAVVKYEIVPNGRSLIKNDGLTIACLNGGMMRLTATELLTVLDPGTSADLPPRLR